jgi:hypothetical protein
MKTSNGSSLLIVLSITTILMLLALGLWYKSSLFLDLVLQREIYYKNFYLTESFLNYGIDLSKDDFDNFLRSETQMPVIFNLNLGEQIDPVQKNFFAQIIVNRLKIKDKFEDKLLIYALLKDVKTLRTVFKLGCKLCRYQTVDVDQKDKKRTEFFVENFTIGNII